MSSLCAPSPVKTLKKFYWCRKCKKKRLHEVRCYEWYSPHASCLKCDNDIIFGDEE